MTAFQEDLSTVLDDIGDARDTLNATIFSLREDDLRLGLRGGWSVDQILHHVVEAERHYARGLASVRGLQIERTAPIRPIKTATTAWTELRRARDQIHSALEGIDEEDFYRLVPLASEEGNGQTYSPLSLLQNIANHDREHTDQITAILTGQERSTRKPHGEPV